MKPAVQDGVTLFTYSREAGDFHAEDVRIGDGRIVFNLVSPLGDIADIELGVPVSVNIENGIAAMALAQIAGATADEIRCSLESLRELYSGRRIKAIFQPHLYTRTRDFYREFADALSLLDDVCIVDIYPAREEPIPGVTSALIYDNLRPGIRRQMCSKDGILDVVRQGGFDVLVTLGAGDIEDYVQQITDILRPLS